MSPTIDTKLVAHLHDYTGGLNPARTKGEDPPSGYATEEEALQACNAITSLTCWPKTHRIEPRPCWMSLPIHYHLWLKRL